MQKKLEKSILSFLLISLLLFLSPMLTNAQLHGDKVLSGQDYYILDEGEHSLEWLFDERPWFPDRSMAKKKLQPVPKGDDHREFNYYSELLSRNDFSEQLQLVFSDHDVIKIITPDLFNQYLSGKYKTSYLFPPRLPTNDTHSLPLIEGVNKKSSFRRRVIRLASPYVTYYEVEKKVQHSRPNLGQVLTAWVPIYRDLTYRKLYSDLLRQAEAKSVRKIKEIDEFEGISNAEMIVNTRLSDHPNWDILSTCKVNIVDNTVGAKSRFDPIIIRDGDQIWIRVVVAFSITESGGAVSGYTDTDEFIIGLASTRKISRVQLSETLKATLEKSPLQLKVADRRSYILAVTSGTSSFVLKGWREMVELRIHFFNEPSEYTGSYKNTVELYISSRLNVNKQNTERPMDWHMATTQQEKRYVETVKWVIRNSISKRYPRGVWSGKYFYID